MEKSLPGINIYTYMKHWNLISLLFVLLLFSSCSRVKVLSTWKSDDRPGVKDKNILVVARTANQEVRYAFENAITDELVANGLNATPSYKQFPLLLPDEKMSEDRNEEIRELLENAGYNAVVLSVLKDYEEITRSMVAEGYEASVNYGYIDAPTYMGWGFYVYFIHPLAYSTEDVYVEETGEDMITSRIFVLETAAFNLDQPEKEQLVTVVRAQVENPQGAAATAVDYAKSIVKGVKKQYR